jgi:hypothetical protein
VQQKATNEKLESPQAHPGEAEIDDSSNESSPFTLCLLSDSVPFREVRGEDKPKGQ